MAFCGNCGTQALEGAVFCGGCGSALNVEIEQAPTAPVVSAPTYNDEVDFECRSVTPTAVSLPAVPVFMPRAKGIDEKFCSTCGGIIKAAAEICPLCGVRQKPPVTLDDDLLDDDYGIASNTRADDRNANINSVLGWVKILLIIGVILALSLPFHYIVGYGGIFGITVVAKKNLGLEKTIITEKTVDNIIKRYNSANFIEKIEISSDPVVKKLFELGIIVRTEDKSQSDNIFDW